MTTYNLVLHLYVWENLLLASEKHLSGRDYLGFHSVLVFSKMLVGVHTIKGFDKVNEIGIDSCVSLLLLFYDLA